MRRRSWSKRLAFAALAILAALAVLEVGVRVLWTPPEGGYPPGMFATDDSVGFRLARSFSARHTTADYDVEVRTNSVGQRGPELRPHPGADRRIVVLGDSFAFGHGVDVEQALPAQLGKTLGGRGINLEVINTAAPGYGTHNQHALLVADGEGWAPDLVLLCLYVGNDFRDNDHRRFGRLVARSGILVTVPDGGAAWPVGLKAAAAVHWWSARLLLTGLPAAARSEEQVVQDYCAAMSWDAGFGTAMVHRTWDPDAAAAFKTTTAWLDRVREWCAAQECAFVLALLPGPQQYHPAFWNLVVEKCGLNPEEYDLAHPNDALVAWGREHGVEVVDLLPPFRQVTTSGPGIRLYLDVHFNAEGHQLAAATLAPRLAPHLAP
ncbi:MAG: hypothetical protein AAF628_25975 [Planctomycetota bacterium]